MNNLPNKKLNKDCLTQRFIGVLLCAGLLLASCTVSTVYHDYRSLAAAGWRATDTIDFHVPVADSAGLYFLSVEARNNNHYPYQSLPLSIACMEGDSLLLYTDTVVLTLASSQGRWEGSGWGGLYQTSQPVVTLSFPRSGMYHVRISHLLPDSIVAGIYDIGICLERVVDRLSLFR